MPFSLLRQNRNFRLIFAATGITNLGDGVSALALPWLASLLTRDPFMIGLVAMAGQLPRFLFTLPAGVLTDRADRRRLMVRADLLRFALTLGLVWMVLSLPALPASPGPGSGVVLSLSLLSFLLGTAEVLRDNAAQTLLPSIVPAQALEQANGQLWSIEQIAGQFIGPPLSGALIALSIALPFGFDATTFLVAAALVWLIALPPRPDPTPQGFWPALAEGMRWFLGHAQVLRLALVLGLFNFLYMMGLTILVLYSQEILGLSAFGHGILLTISAAGGVIGGMIGPVVAARIGNRASLLVGLAGFVASSAILALAVTPWMAAIALFCESVTGMIWNIVTVSWRQRHIPAHLLGRVNSIYRFFGTGTLPLGALAGGALVAALAPDLGRDLALRTPFAVAALLATVLTIYSALRLRLD